MKKLAIALSLFLILQTTTVAANELNKDPFTMFIQEILVELGLLDTHATGINDKPTQKAIMSFQEKAGLEKIDGIVGDETYPKLLLGETAYSTTTTFIDTHPPQWAEDPLSIININNNWAAPKVMRATILWGHITDNVGIDKYQIYVDGELYTTIPGLGCITKCSSQSSGVNARVSNLIKDNYHTIEVRACDEAGNCSTNNPTITKKFKETTSVPTTTTTTTILPGTPTVTITSSQVSDGDTSADSSITLTFITSESTTNFAAGDVTVSGGTLSNFIGFGTEYAATFTPTAQGATTIDVASSTFTNASTGADNTAATQFNWTYVVSNKLADCGNSSTNANRWVVSVVDEDDNQSLSSMTASWSTFRNSYPDRCFHLLEPHVLQGEPDYTTHTTFNGVNSYLFIPTAFINELSAGTTFYAKVSRSSNSSVSGTSDWWDLIGASVLPSGAKIGLCIDNSGSMYASTVQASLDLFEQKAAAAGVTIAPSSNGWDNYFCTGMPEEDWILGLTVDIN